MERPQTRRPLERRAPARAPARTALLVSVTSVVIALSTAPLAAQDGPSPISQGVAQLSEAEADAIIADIERVVDVAEEDLAAFRSDRLDPEVVVAAVGGDPVAIRDWVVQNTRWMPYRGALRGADGVLMDRLGSNLDRALLLARLIEEAGFGTRLAQATLSDDVAAALLEQELDRPSLEAEVEPILAPAEEIEQHRSAAEQASRRLSKLVGLAAGAGADGDAHEAMADHWWVEAEVDGTWQALDLVFGDDATERPAAASILDADDLPDDQRHTVTVRVDLEDWDGEGLASWTPLEHTIALGSGSPLPSAELTFEYAFDEEPESPIETIEAVAALADFWRPVLWADGSRVRGEWFTTSGLADGPTSNVVEEKTEMAASAIGGLGADEPQGPAPSELSAVTLEYVVEGPGAEPLVVRRDLYDLLGPARRSAGGLGMPAASEDERLARSAALLGTTDILVQASALHPDGLLRSWLQSYVDNRSALIALVYVAAGREDDRILPSMVSNRPQPIELLSMAMARSSWRPTAGSTYLARPNVWTEHLVFEPGEAGLEPAEAIDIVVNDVAVAPGAGIDPNLARLQQGVTDTMVEHLLATEPGDNAWARFDATTEPWTAVGSVAALESIAEALPADVHERILGLVADGGVAVVEPAVGGGGPHHWWAIDADRGTTLGIGARGWGANLPENRSINIVASNTVRGAARRQLGTRWVAEGRDMGTLAGRIQAQAARARGIQVEEMNRGVIRAVYELGKR